MTFRSRCKQPVPRHVVRFQRADQSEHPPQVVSPRGDRQGSLSELTPEFDKRERSVPRARCAYRLRIPFVAQSCRDTKCHGVSSVSLQVSEAVVVRTEAEARESAA